MQKLLGDLYAFFHVQPKRQAFKGMHSLLHADAALKSLAPHKVWWLGVADCITRFLRTYPFVTAAVADAHRDALKQCDGNAKSAEQLLAGLKEHINLAVICTINGALQSLWSLSKKLQTKGLSLEASVQATHFCRSEVFQSHCTAELQLQDGTLTTQIDCKRKVCCHNIKQLPLACCSTHIAK